MTGLLDNHQVDISCAKCGHKFKETLGRLKNNPMLKCTRCGTNIQIDSGGPQGLATGLKKMDNALADLQRSVKKLGK
ncbi:hypothetical protein [Acidovorax sp. BL-A-41-H1]|uniref:hypothetical protein n=1 Tax=Acidovorax sp. BL-A-41-H1 TaxID=3421102 RepID=UPI003F7A6ACE